MTQIHKTYQTILERRASSPDDSYVARLYAKGIEKITQKVGEEAVETAIASIKGNRGEIIAESTDLIFHLLIMLAWHGISPDEIFAEIERREGQSGIMEKLSRQKEQEKKG
jgi:phosphoribosyl-ATP pyrophosphohydrolase